MGFWGALADVYDLFLYLFGRCGLLYYISVIYLLFLFSYGILVVGCGGVSSYEVVCDDQSIHGNQTQ